MKITLTSIIASFLLVSSSEIDTRDMPRSVCGWPSLHETGRFPPANTRIAQRMLSIAIDQPITIDGVFTSETTAQIEEFESIYGLEINGYLNIDTWPTLIDLMSPLEYGSSGLAVEALQDALNWNGFDVTETGVYDEETRNATSTFQLLRGASEITGETVDYQTWNLLITQCNSTNTPSFWYDAGWPQGEMSIDTLKCLLDTGFEYAIFECWREKDMGTWWQECVPNIDNAWQAGYSSVGVYMYPNRNRDPAAQAAELVGNLTLNNVKYGLIMLDIEGDDWFDYSIESNQEFMLGLRSIFDQYDQKLSVYCSALWETYFGTNFTAFSDTPLIYAHYDNIPSFYDWDYAPYGGWKSASGKQFWDGVSPEIMCDIALDWDWSPAPFW